MLAAAQRKKLACVRRLKRNSAPKQLSVVARKKKRVSAPRKKLPGPPRNPSLLLKSNDLKLKSRRQHQLMHQISKSRKLPNGLKLVWKTGPRPRPSQTNRRIISAARRMTTTPSFEL